MVGWITLVLLNTAVVLIMMGLQFLYCATAPAIDPKVAFKNNADKKNAFVQATMDINRPLIIELVLGVTLISLVNYLYFRKTTFRPIHWTVLLFFGIVITAGLSLTWFSVDYYNRNMQK